MPLQADSVGDPTSEFPDLTAARVHAVRRSSDRVLVPLSGALLTFAFTGSLAGAVLGLLAFGLAAFALPAQQGWANLLPLMRSPLHATKPLVGVAILAILEWATDSPALSMIELVAVGIGTTLAGMVPHILMPQSWAPDRTIRIAVLGSVRVAEELAAELRLEDVPGYTVVGRISYAVDENPGPQAVPELGSLSELSEIVKRHDIRLLIFSSEVPRYALFSEVADNLLDRPVRLWELSGFYEEVSGTSPWPRSTPHGSSASPPQVPRRDAAARTRA